MNQPDNTSKPVEQDADKQYHQMDGPQGDDKAPGEELPTTKVDEMKERQKGKTVDGDPTEPEDQPLKQSEIIS